MQRFFCEFELTAENTRLTIVDRDVVHQIKNVLRYETGDQIAVCDGTGLEYLVELTEISKDAVSGNITVMETNMAEPKVAVTIYQSLLQRDNFDWFLKEIPAAGVMRVVPVVYERTIVRKTPEAKIERWQKILKEGAEQSGRGKVPQIEGVLTFEEAVARVSANKGAVGLIAHMEGLAVGKIPQLKGAYEAAVFIGPEGGFSPYEIELARKSGIIVLSFGPRVFRSEVAGLVACALLLQ